MDKEYNLRDSTKTVGELYPVLLAKDGSVIDGRHRREGDPFWRTETLEHIDTEDKILLARAVANWHRRQVSREEKGVWINGLASIYQEQGLKVYGPNRTNEITTKLMEELGVVRQTVLTYLDPEYKQTGKGGNQGGPRVPASQAIEKMAQHHPRYASDIVGRHREEVKKELLNDPDFQAEVIQKVGREAGRPALALDLIDEGPTHQEPPEELPLIAEARIRSSPLCLCSQCPQEAECSSIDMGAQSARNMVIHHQEALKRIQAGEKDADFLKRYEIRTLKLHGILTREGTRPAQITDAAKLILDNL